MTALTWTRGVEMTLFSEATDSTVIGEAQLPNGGTCLSRVMAEHKVEGRFANNC